MTDQENTKTPVNIDKKDEVIEIPIGKFISNARNNPWSVSTVILAVILISVLVFNFPAAYTFSNTKVDPDVAGTNALTFIQSNPTLEGEVGLVSVQETNGFYEVILNYQGRDVPVYVTLDGEFLLTGAPVSLTDQANIEAQQNPPTQPPTQQPPPGEPIEIDEGDDAVLGDINAPVTMIEYSDYQCPFCQRFWSDTLPLIKENYIETGKVKFIYKDFPLSMHPQAQISAEASECVRTQGGDEAFWDYHDQIFANQATLSEENLIKWAKDMNYNIEECLSSGQFTDEVLADLNEGSAAGISGTPGFFINGIQVSGAQPYSSFEALIEAQLAAQ
jgi:protein-disulfide isomerase